jgi:hypothetical protein
MLQLGSNYVRMDEIVAVMEGGRGHNEQGEPIQVPPAVVLRNGQLLGNPYGAVKLMAVLMEYGFGKVEVVLGEPPQRSGAGIKKDPLAFPTGTMIPPAPVEDGKPSPDHPEDWRDPPPMDEGDK